MFLLIFTAAGLSAAPFRIVLDAGHGGTEKGAVSGEFIEKELNLKLARMVRSQLVRMGGITVTMTRDEDETLLAKERVQLIEKAQPDFVFSIHFNSDRFVISNRGFEIYYPADNWEGAPSDYFPRYDRSNRSFAAGKLVRDRFLKSPLKTKWQHHLNLFTTTDIYIFNNTAIPSLLFEIAYLTSENNRSLIADEAFLEETARFIAEAIAEIGKNSVIVK